MSELAIFLPAENDYPFLIYDPVTGETLESFFSEDIKDGRFSGRYANVVIPLSRLSVAVVTLPGNVKQKKKALPYSLEKYIIGDLSAIEFFVSNFALTDTVAYWLNRDWLISVLEKLKNAGLLILNVVAQPRAITNNSGNYLCMKVGVGLFLLRGDGFFWRLDESRYVIDRLKEKLDKFSLISCDSESDDFLKNFKRMRRDYSWWQANFSRNDNWLISKALCRFLSRRRQYEWLVLCFRKLFLSSSLVFFCSTILFSYGFIDYHRYKKAAQSLIKSTCTSFNPGCVSEKLRLLKHSLGLIDSSDFLPMIAILQRAYRVESLPVVHHIIYDRGTLKIYYSGKKLLPTAHRVLETVFKQAGYLVDSTEENNFLLMVVRYV
ncbi:hypothetical protein [Candidatus Ichthyocystis sparus]|uniref:hypothetical protein n=1 Tax=Candidatus Ichthyocystis sparus TaxID=1561004 RepID=UPI0011476658|nr:hypothetical protein [Candidatus Ichthyocystis sparus]